MKMVIFKILTLFVVTSTTAFGTTTEIFQRANLDIDTINVTCIDKMKEDCRVNFGALGVRQIVIKYKNLATNEGDMTLYVGDLFGSRINLASAIRTGEATYEVTEMVDIKPGTRKIYLNEPPQLAKYNKHGKIDTDQFKIESILFIPKKLNAENPYRIISPAEDLVLINKHWSYSLEDKVVLMRHNDTCQYQEQFHFERNTKGEYRIYQGQTKGSSDGKYLEVRDKSVKIGNEVVLVDYPGNEDNVWSLLPGFGDSPVKIQSKLTGTCISAVHGFASNLVMVDCENGRDNVWELKFCDD